MSLKTLRLFMCHFDKKTTEFTLLQKVGSAKRDELLFIGYTFLNINDAIYSQCDLVVYIPGGQIESEL